MSLATDMAAKVSKRAAAHAIHVSNVVTPSTAVPTVETDAAVITPSALQAGMAYPSPPF